MTFEELMKTPELERKATYDRFVDSHSEAIHERNKENKSLRDRLKGVNPKAMELYQKMKDKFGVEEVNDELLDSLQESSQSKQTVEAKLLQLQRKLESESKEKTELYTKLSASEKAQQERDRDSILLSELGKANIRTDSMADAIRIAAIDSVYDPDAGWLFSGKKLSEYIPDFVKSRPHWVGNPVRGGSGSSTSSAGIASVADFISEEDYLKLSDAERNTREMVNLANKSMPRWNGK